MPFKRWAPLEGVNADELHEFIQDQVIATFDDSADRDLPEANSGIETPLHGQFAFTKDDEEVWVYNVNGEWERYGRVGPWGTYTPALSTTGGTFDPGTGATQFGRWRRSGTEAQVGIFVQLGSSGVSVAAGIVEVTLPTECPAESDWYGAQEIIVGNGIAIDNDTQTRYAVAAKIVGSTTLRIEADGLTGPVTESNLMTWAASDILLSAVVTYECEAST